jgi:hypothetical protein
MCVLSLKISKFEILNLQMILNVHIINTKVVVADMIYIFSVDKFFLLSFCSVSNIYFKNHIF